MIQALLLKIAALSLILMLGQNANLPEDFRAQATLVANQAMAAADAELSKPASPEPSLGTNVLPITSSPSNPTPSVINNPTPMPETPVSQARIEIVNNPGDLTKDYSVLPAACKLLYGSNFNEVDCGGINSDAGHVLLKVVLYNDDGSVNQTATMDVSATDDRQNKALNGTGDMVPIMLNGQRTQVYGYIFGYYFLSAGAHQITFTANGVSKSVTLTTK